MNFGELVSIVGAVELVLLLLALAAMLVRGGPPPRLDIQPDVEPVEATVKEAA